MATARQHRGDQSSVLRFGANAFGAVIIAGARHVDPAHHSTLEILVIGINAAVNDGNFHALTLRNIPSLHNAGLLQPVLSVANIIGRRRSGAYHSQRTGHDNRHQRGCGAT